MAKKFGKFLAVTAVIAAAGAGAIALYKKFKEQELDDDFDDFDDDDFDDDFEDDLEASDRGYTAIPIETDAVDEALSETTDAATSETTPADEKDTTSTEKKGKK